MPVSQSATIGKYLKKHVYSMVYSGPTWLVSLSATEKVVYVSYTNYTSVNHTVNPTFLHLKNVRPIKEMGSYLAKLVGFWLMADCYFHS